MPKHAFLGMGIMGAAMAANLGRSGLVTNVWNRTTTNPGIQIAKKAGCKVTKSIEEAVNNVDFIFICVSDAPDVEKVLFSSGASWTVPDTLPFGQQSLVPFMAGQKLRWKVTSND